MFWFIALTLTWLRLYTFTCKKDGTWNNKGEQFQRPNNDIEIATLNTLKIIAINTLHS